MTKKPDPQEDLCATLSVHWKQGDDLSAHLDASDGRVVQALRSWADGMTAAAEKVREVAAALEGRRVMISADTHHIGFSGLDRETLAMLEKTGIVHEEKFEEDEDEGGTEPENAEFLEE